MRWDASLAFDGAIVLGYFALIVWIGLSLGTRDKSLEGFALGGRNMPWLAVLASIIAAETSAGTFLGTPGEGYATRSFLYLQLVFGTIIARVLVAYVFLKPYYDHKVYSVYEYLTVRFGTRTKNAASAVFLVTRVLASGTRLYVAAIVIAVAFELLTGTRPGPHEQLAIYLGAIVFMTVLTAIYTAIGGIKAVIWTDFIQAALMLGSALVAIGVLYTHIPGGWGTIHDSLNGFRDVKFFATGTVAGATFWANVKNVLGSEYTIWAGLLGSTFITMATHGTDQDMVQRMLTTKDYQRSRLSLIFSGVADIPIVLIFLTIGILLWVYYTVVPHPHLPQMTNEIFPYFIWTEMPVGARGLLVAGVFATAMGSLSAALNALATSFTRDWYLPFQSGPKTEEQVLTAARKFTAVFAGLMILVAGATAYFVILHPGARIIPIALGIFGYTYGSLLGVFLLGMLTKTRGNDTGNLIAMSTGFVVVAILSNLPNELLGLAGMPTYEVPGWLPVIEFPWRIMFGTVTTFAVGAMFRTKR
jgi:SSS family transporter